jgi:hypothetical protein
MQIPPRPRTAVLFDSSLENSIGQVLALATLLAADVRRDVRLGSLSVSRNSLEIAAFCDLMVRFYRGDRPGSPPDGGSIPIGMFDAGVSVGPVAPTIAAVVDRRGPDGRPLYPRAIARHNDTADPVAVIRNALSAQEDQAAVVVLAGPPVNLLGLVDLPGGSELVEAKVRELVLTPEVPSDSGLRDLIERWPSPIVHAQDDSTVRYPPEAVEQDLLWATYHPVIDAYRAAVAVPGDASADAALAVLYAVRPDGNYFSLSGIEESGAVSYRRVTSRIGERDNALDEIRALVSARPPERGRGRG